MMMRASEPPMKYRRSFLLVDFVDACDIAVSPLTRKLTRSILKVLNNMPSTSILKVSIRQLKAARALLAWSQEHLAAAAAVSVPTIKRLEAQDGPLGGRHETAAKIKSALEGAGIEFINENGGGPGVRLRRRQQKKG
jgi:DNA-binding XRE family transcriptional regulator